MDVKLSSRSNPPIVDIWPTVLPNDPRPDPLASIRRFLPDVLPSLGHPECFSGRDCFFHNASRDLGGSSTVGKGFLPQHVTKLDDTWLLVEGISGSGVGNGDLAVDQTVDVEPASFSAMLLGTEVSTSDRSQIEAALEALERSPRWAKRGKSFEAIGFAVLRTNDPLIT